MNKSVVIMGEASESDTENDNIHKNLPMNMIGSIQGSVVFGEDSESEAENDSSICSAVSALNHLDIKDDNAPKYDSLLHQKLRESNNRLVERIDEFCNNTFEEAYKTLATLDQQLLRSHVTLQNAVTSFKTFGSNSALLKNKLHSILSAKFIPNVNVTK